MLCGLHKRTVKRNSAPSLQRNLRNFLPLFKLSLHRSPQSPRLPTSFTDTLGLLLHRPNIKSYKTGDFKPWVVCTCHTHTGSGQGPEILACVAKWGKNIHSKFQVCSYHSFKDISILKPKFRVCVKLPLFSDPATFEFWYLNVWHCK